MKILKYVVCCGSCSLIGNGQPTEETRLLLGQKARRRPGRLRRRLRGGARDWHPSLTSISEENDVVLAERNNNIKAKWPMIFKGKVSCLSSRDRRDSADFDANHARRASHPTILTSFVPTPFMF